VSFSIYRSVIPSKTTNAQYFHFTDLNYFFYTFWSWARCHFNLCNYNVVRIFCSQDIYKNSISLNYWIPIMYDHVFYLRNMNYLCQMADDARKDIQYVRFHDLMAVSMKMTAFWDTKLCSLKVDRRFRGVHCRHLTLMI
jgi:hypothetical protein